MISNREKKNIYFENSPKITFSKFRSNSPLGVEDAVGRLLSLTQLIST
jgi:hypothetical protein